MKKNIVLLLISLVFLVKGYSQEKNFIDQPYVETSAKVDTLIVPDRIFLNILITEEDTKGRTSVEELENRMATKLKMLGIDIDKQLYLSDVSSDFKKYFLRKKEVLKNKSYTLITNDALTAGKVIQELEKINISNILLQKTEYSKMEQLQLRLKSKAIEKAKINAESMVKPLNQKVGAAIYISDLSNMASQLQGRAAGVQIRGMSSVTEYKPLDIEFEKIKVESQVYAKFIIE
ncbi:MAG: SIMPL domain-containing protein [Flavobacteriaceae bacterium]|nr:SIMPL domain-containing protein [Flavobacteriaceae bacterium]|tara:strand:- start:6348 stop:7046 length:699 start_codon:yes stop_codon:yes gene_type:complete